ncbi:MAG: hypothetical protein EBU84_07245 [Actinobacteria bacterium]|nr:hypothetical protein [Actinomycetota bacterium]
MSKFNDALDKSSALEEEIRLLRSQERKSQGELQRLKSELAEVQKTLETTENILGANLTPPKWLSPEKPKSSAATIKVILSDTHFDEVVNPDEVDGLNAYNREIAEMRLERWAQNIIKVSRHYLSGMKYDGVVLSLGGDIFSGDIHEELKETNADTILGSLLHWSERIAGAIGLLHDEFKKVHVVSVVGNHGRTSRKPRAKLRAKTNFDWLLAKMLERHFADTSSDVSFQIPDGADALIKIYEHGHLLTHGDQASGGGGIGGVWPPIMRLRARKAQRYLAIGENFQTMWCGHWHQLVQTPGLIVNGSLKGWDEYAAVSNFPYEQPQQAFAIITPDNGITIQAPIFCQNRKKEGW